MKWTDNKGSQPESTKGKRVIVELRNGNVCGVEAVTTTSPNGWFADHARWSLEGFEFDILRWRKA